MRLPLPAARTMMSIFMGAAESMPQDDLEQPLIIGTLAKKRGEFNHPLGKRIAETITVMSV
jgi:hypothetical protein